MEWERERERGKFEVESFWTRHGDEKQKKAKAKSKLTFRNHTIVRSPLVPFFSSTPMAAASSLVMLVAAEDEGMEVEKAARLIGRCRCDNDGCCLAF